jgi:hypothetical protein
MFQVSLLRDSLLRNNILKGKTDINSQMIQFPCVFISDAESVWPSCFVLLILFFFCFHYKIISISVIFAIVTVLFTISMSSCCFYCYYHHNHHVPVSV